MPPEIAKYLFDMEEAGRAILDLAQKSSIEEFRTTRWLRSSIEREFIIIGEALRNAIALKPELAARISDSRSIIGFAISSCMDMPRWIGTLSGASSSTTFRVFCKKYSPA